MVTATDSSSRSDSITVEIAVTDVDEAPTINVGAYISRL